MKWVMLCIGKNLFGHMISHIDLMVKEMKIRFTGLFCKITLEDVEHSVPVSYINIRSIKELCSSDMKYLKELVEDNDDNVFDEYATQLIADKMSEALKDFFFSL